jgi:2-methylcitrate dehydratase PrpD
MVSTGQNNPYTQAMAKFVAELRYGDVPEAVRERIKLLILDSLGCAVFGTGSNGAKSLFRLWETSTARADARCWGTGKRLSAPHAALANGALVQSFELDDVHRDGVLHCRSCNACRRLFAVAELKAG